jgi:hypothetical protein
MNGRTQRIVRAATTAAWVVAAAGLAGAITIGLFFTIGRPWGTLNDVAGLVMTAALAPLMLAFYELGGLTPLRLAQAAQAIGQLSIVTWCVAHALMIAGAVEFDYSRAATGAFAIENLALVVIGLWVAGANLLAGRWLNWVRWIGVLAGLGAASLGAGLYFGGESHPLTVAGGGPYLLVVPLWAALMARLLGRRAAEGAR